MLDMDVKAFGLPKVFWSTVSYANTEPFGSLIGIRTELHQFENVTGYPLDRCGLSLELQKEMPFAVGNCGLDEIYF
ncbi:hypothetical protein CEXT_109681 [Caerostris extrusa]|uniref:Uncharacterized protein n=1 Tax=Caerostris extrusa TaxID=172846 RepID=A0AAV4MBZ9_CAEEX|nr:hypothetical protein CEXT_109681 [Caerostris extrusa]